MVRHILPRGDGKETVKKTPSNEKGAEQQSWFKECASGAQRNGARCTADAMQKGKSTYSVQIGFAPSLQEMLADEVTAHPQD